MSRTAILKIDIISDARKANAEFDKAAGHTSKLESSFKGLNRAADVGAAAVAGIAVVAVKSAAEAEQAVGAVESVFKDYAHNVEGFAADAAKSVGLSETQYNNFAARIGAQFKNLGVPMEELAGKTDELVSRGADLAATFGGTTADAVDALSAAFRGEFDPLERYGIAIRKSDVNARLAAEGLSDLEGEALKSAEQQATWAMVMEQSGDAAGQFSREAGTASGSMAILTAEWENAKAELGEALLPLMVELAEHLLTATEWVIANKDAIEKWVIIGAGVYGTLKTVAAGIAIYKAASTGIKTLGALFGLGQAAAAAGSAATIAAAHGTAATTTSVAWATSSTASTTAIGGLAIAAGIEAGIITLALVTAATATSAAWGIAAGSVLEDLDEVRAAAESLTEAWNLEAMTEAATGAAESVALIRGELDATAAQTAALIESLGGVSVALADQTTLWGIWSGAARDGVVAVYGEAAILAQVVGPDLRSQLEATGAQFGAWAGGAVGNADAVAAGLERTAAAADTLGGAYGRLVSPLDTFINYGDTAFSVWSSVLSGIESYVALLIRTVGRAIREMGRLIDAGRRAVSAGFWDGGLLNDAVPPEFVGEAALPPGVLFASAHPGWLGRLTTPAAQPAPAGVTNNITVNGALDPIAVADQIRNVIDQTDRARGAALTAGFRR